MLDAAAHRERNQRTARASFARMDAEQLPFSNASFDGALCDLGLMYRPDPAAAVRELKRVMRPGGRAVLAVSGERASCGWAPLFGIVDGEVRSEVCPLLFGLGQGDALARCGKSAGLQPVAQQRILITLDDADAEAACAAAFVGGPVLLASSRFGDLRRLAASAGAGALRRCHRAVARWRGLSRACSVFDRRGSSSVAGRHQQDSVMPKRTTGMLAHRPHGRKIVSGRRPDPLDFHPANRDVARRGMLASVFCTGGGCVHRVPRTHPQPIRGATVPERPSGLNERARVPVGPARSTANARVNAGACSRQTLVNRRTDEPA